MGLTLIKQTELVENLSERTGYSKGDVKHFLVALEEEVQDAVRNCNKVKVAGVQIEPKLRKASKARMGRNPQSGEAVKIAAKPASVKVAARVLTTLKNAAPSVKKLQNAS